MNSHSPQAESALGPGVTRRVSDRLMALIMTGLLFVVGAISLGSMTQPVSTGDAGLSPLVQQRSLVFADATGGRIRVLDSETGAELGVYESGKGSFVRGVVRSLVWSRQQMGIASQTPFVLSAYAGGRLILSDPTTGQHIELGAFGPTNAGDFSAFLEFDSADSGA